MDATLFTIGIMFLGAAIGVLVTWLVMRAEARSSPGTLEQVRKLQAAVQDLSGALRAEAGKGTLLRERCAALEEDLSGAVREAMDLTGRLSEARAQKQALEEKLEAQKSEVEEIRKRSEMEFRNIANEILEDKSARFTELNRSSLEAVLKPLGENIEGFKQKVQEVYEKESKERFSLGREVEKLVQANQKVSEEANNLTRALKGDAKKQGDWGQMILENILECSGLVKGREYLVQEFLREEDGSTLKNEEGARLQPDVIIRYPDNRKVIIDSKVSLVAYERYANAESRQDQDRGLQEHLRSLRTHIDELSAKCYQDFAPSLDFVMMFVPIEPAYLAAINADGELWSYAYRKRIVLISPTNLIAALKLIADLWKREYQNRNAQEIAERGGQLYDKLVGFVESLGEVGDSLDRAQRFYEKACRQLKDGNGNLIAQAEKMKELGARARKTLPAAFAADGQPEDPAPAGALQHAVPGELQP